MLVHSLEIVTIVVLGVIYLYPDLFDAQQQDKTEIEQPPKSTKAQWFHKLVHFISKLEGNIGPRIHADSCCICYENIKNEVQSCCGHVFCGSILFSPLLTLIRFMLIPSLESSTSCQNLMPLVQEANTNNHLKFIEGLKCP